MLLGHLDFESKWLSVYKKEGKGSGNGARDVTGLQRQLAVVILAELEPLLFERTTALRTTVLGTTALGTTALGTAGCSEELRVFLAHALLETRPAARASARDVLKWFEERRCDVGRPSRSSFLPRVPCDDVLAAAFQASCNAGGWELEPNADGGSKFREDARGRSRATTKPTKSTKLTRNDDADTRADDGANGSDDASASPLPSSPPPPPLSLGAPPDHDLFSLLSLLSLVEGFEEHGDALDDNTDEEDDAVAAAEPVAAPGGRSSVVAARPRFGTCKGSAGDLKALEKAGQARAALRQGRAALTPSHATPEAPSPDRAAPALRSAEWRVGVAASRPASSGNLVALATSPFFCSWRQPPVP